MASHQTHGILRSLIRTKMSGSSVATLIGLPSAMFGCALTAIFGVLLDSTFADIFRLVASDYGVLRIPGYVIGSSGDNQEQQLDFLVIYHDPDNIHRNRGDRDIIVGCGKNSSPDSTLEFYGIWTKDLDTSRTSLGPNGNDKLPKRRVDKQNGIIVYNSIRKREINVVGSEAFQHNCGFYETEREAIDREADGLPSLYVMSNKEMLSQMIIILFFLTLSIVSWAALLAVKSQEKQISKTEMSKRDDKNYTKEGLSF